jgi:Zn-dependent peptidase ImmA (M78 family)
VTNGVHPVNEDAEQARQYRVRVGLDLRGPIPDLLHVAEDVAEVAVSVIDLPEGVSGAYTYEEGQGFAFVNVNDSVVRQRFTLAHELAHHVYKDAAIIDPESNVFGSPKSPRERRANTFAAEFLIPLQAVNAWMEARGASNVDLRLVVELASFFRVSAKAALIRLQLARFIDAAGPLGKVLDASVESGEHTRLSRRLGIEEAPDALSEIKKRDVPRVPAKMWEYAVVGYERGLLTVERIAEAVYKTPADVKAELDDLGIAPPPDDPDY